MSLVERMDSLIESLSKGKSSLVDSWFLMSSPIPVFTMVGLYIVFIIVGPKIMKNRPPMRLDKIIMSYNAFQVILSVLICYKALRLNKLLTHGVIHAGCYYGVTSLDPALLDLGWWYSFAKITELLDTVFFIVRKKEKQVTFLHLYHHGSMALYAWCYIKFAAAGEGAILALLNSAIHVVMYTYYFLAGLGPQYQKYLWWKKYVTSLQMMQFLIMLSYNLFSYASDVCDYDVRFTTFISFNISVFLFLFYNFYSASYKKDSKTRDVNINKEKESSNDYTNCDITNSPKNSNGILNKRILRSL